MTRTRRVYWPTRSHMLIYVLVFAAGAVSGILGFIFFALFLPMFRHGGYH